MTADADEETVVKCGKCNLDCVLEPDMFFLDGVYFTGYVCRPCNNLYVNEDDSIFDYEKKQKEKTTDE